MDLSARLEHLVRIDLDAVRAYTQAIGNVADAQLRDMLTGFRADHLRHIDDLSEHLTRRGRHVPQQPHMTGVALAGFTGIAAGISPLGAMMVLQSDEIVTNQAYQMALHVKDLPEDIAHLLRANLADEHRHLAAIRGWLRHASPMGAAMSGSATLQGMGASLWLNVVRSNPVATVAAATGAAFLLGNFLRNRRGQQHAISPHARH